jgi:hypothetical protein
MALHEQPKQNQHIYQCVNLRDMMAIASIDKKDTFDHISIHADLCVVKSVHIPWIHKNTTAEFITRAFNKSGWGIVNSVDLKKNADNDHQYGFVHFSQLYYNFKPIDEYLAKDRENVFKFYYNGPHYWMVKSVDKNIDQNDIMNVWCELIIPASMFEDSDDEDEDEE